jgi:hypothetical protein
MICKNIVNKLSKISLNSSTNLLSNKINIINYQLLNKIIEILVNKEDNMFTILLIIYIYNKLNLYSYENTNNKNARNLLRQKIYKNYKNQVQINLQNIKNL